MVIRGGVGYKKTKSSLSNNVVDPEQASQPLVGNQVETNEPSKGVTGGKADRAIAIIDQLKAGEVKGPLMEGIRCFLTYGVKPLIVIIMAYVWLGKQIYKIYLILPVNVVQMILGALLCFFGGTYCYTIAAFEAFRSFGGAALLDELAIIWEEAQNAAAASEADDKVDANNDGIMDVKQMSTNDLITHKARVAMAAIEDPQRFHNAFQYLLSAWFSVLAVLKFQFAKTVAIALGIVDMVCLPITRVIGPFLATMVGDDLKKWVPPMIRVTCQIGAVIVAGFIQKVTCAYYSGLRGATMFAEAFITILGEKGLLDKLPDSIVSKPFDANLSYLDEIIGYPLAVAGVFWQYTNLFTVPFPWSIAMMPISMCEWYIMFAVNT